MSDLKMKCASCGLPGHRYGRNEGMDRYDPMACINQLRGVLENLLANGQRVEWCEEHRHEGFDSEHEPGWVCEWGAWVEDRGRWDCRIVSKLLIDPTTGEE